MPNESTTYDGKPDERQSKSQPGQAGIEDWRLNIEDLWYRFAPSFLLKSIVRPSR